MPQLPAEPVESEVGADLLAASRTRDTAAGSVWWTAADAAAGEPGKDRMPEVADPADAQRPPTGD